MADKNDWRRRGQEAYLRGVALLRRPWVRPRPDWDHDHCAFCWEKFSEADGGGTITEGYTTVEGQHWICDQCFADFRGEFKWEVKRTASVTCPCCGYITLTEPQAWEICPVCFWEDEPIQDPHKPMGGANSELSLYEAQQNFLAFGACDLKSASAVRPVRVGDKRDPKWRPLPPPTTNHQRD